MKPEVNTGFMNRLALYDSEIAAVACVNQLVVVTRNTDDFLIINDLEIENWFDD